MCHFNAMWLPQILALKSAETVEITTKLIRLHKPHFQSFTAESVAKSQARVLVMKALNRWNRD
jgi:hypothetical protein